MKELNTESIHNKAKALVQPAQKPLEPLESSDPKKDGYLDDDVIEAELNKLRACVIGLDECESVDIETMQSVIEDFCTPREAYFIMKYSHDVDIKRMEAVIVDHLDVRYAYLAARDIHGVDINKMAHVIMNHGGGMDMCLFAKDVKGADILSIQEKVWTKGSIDDKMFFIRKVKGADRGRDPFSR